MFRVNKIPNVCKNYGVSRIGILIHDHGSCWDITDPVDNHHDILHGSKDINIQSVENRERRDVPLPSLVKRQSGSSNDTNNDRRRIFEQPWVRESYGLTVANSRHVHSHLSLSLSLSLV